MSWATASTGMASALVFVGTVWLVGVRNFNFEVDHLVPHGLLFPFGVDSLHGVGVFAEMVSLS